MTRQPPPRRGCRGRLSGWPALCALGCAVLGLGGCSCQPQPLADAGTVEQDAAAADRWAVVDAGRDSALDATDASLRDSAPDGQADSGVESGVDGGENDAGDNDAGDNDGGPDGGPMTNGVFTLAVAERTLLLTVLEDGILRVHYVSGSHPHPDRGWTMLPQRWPTTALPVVDRGDRFAVDTAALQIAVLKADATVIIADSGGPVLSEDLSWSAGELCGVSKRIAGDERFYGFGEKTGHLDKRGQHLEMWTTDPWYPEPDFSPTSDPIYQSHPFFVAVRGGRAYGIYLNNTFRSVFDIGAAEANVLKLAVAGGDLDYLFFHGPSVAAVIEKYTRLVGRSALPPLWALGYHQCRWSYAPESEVRDIVAGFQERAIPLDGIWLDIDYMDGFRSFTWDPVGFANPRRLLADLSALGVKTTVIVDPGIKQQQAGGYGAYDTGVANGHFVTWPSGETYVGNVWPGAAVFPDFTRPATRDWWAGWTRTLVDDGAAGIWIDMNEPTTWQDGGFPLDTRFDGEGQPTDHRETRNVYALLMARATRQGMLAAAPQRRPFVLTRAGFSGVQQHAAVWTGDARSEWSHLAMAPQMLMNLGLSGVAMVGSDVGGFSGDPGPELFARWMQLGLLSPFFRTHVMSGAPRQEPWSFGRSVEQISRQAIELRYRLLPYLYALMHQASVTGAPALRPLLFEFQTDAATHGLDDEMMLGPHLLAAPVVQPGLTQRPVYLPAGVWIDFYSAAVLVGPTTTVAPAPLERLPLFARGNAVIPMWPVQQHVGAVAPDRLYLDLFPAVGAPPQRFGVYLDDGTSFAFESGASHLVDLELTATATGAAIAIGAERGTFEPAHQALRLRWHGVAVTPTAVQRDGQPLAQAALFSDLDRGDGWFHDPVAQILHTRIARPTAGATVVAHYDVAARAPRQVQIELTVELPPSTPAHDVIYFASDLDGWTSDARPLTRIDPTLAALVLEVEEGRRFEYKFTRGAWSTVETDAICVELPNRARIALGDHDARQGVVDTVARWRDIDCR
ncbi:MAG: glycoside hydrolase family 31 protein [Deltaproteobacteria bacterium]|nr:glycoside hydrolase family 31 protein [Deltaproteobacteria bacterium]